MKNAIIYLIVFLAIQCGVTLGVREIWRIATGSPDLTTMLLVVSMAAFSAVTIAVFLLARWCEVARSYVRSRPWGVLTWCVVAAVGAIVPSVWLQEFRGAILRSLLRTMRNRWVAIAVSALLFALAHGNPAQMPHALLVGLLLGWMYCRTDSIVPGVAYHWANNTIAYVLYNIMPAPDAPLIVLFGGSQRAVIMAVVFSLCILLPAILQLNLRMKKADRGVMRR